MKAWFIGTPDGGNVYAAMEIMKSEPINCDEDSREKIVNFLKKNERWDNEKITVQPVEYIWIDGGGMVRKGEPRVQFVANETPFAMHVRQLPFVIEHFEATKDDDPGMQGVIHMGGFCRHYIISLKTRDAAVEEMKNLLKGTESLRQEEEIRVHQLMNRAGGVSLRQCGCLSGKKYAECCGKAYGEKDMEIAKQIEETEQGKHRRTIL